MRLDLKPLWAKRRRAVPALRRRLLRRTRQLLRRMPGGSALKAARMKRAIASGSLHDLVPVESLSKYFRWAIKDLTSGVDSELRYFEAGVYCGQSLAVWFEACANEGVESRAYGADSFLGLPPQARKDEGGWDEAMFWCPREVAEWNLKRLGVPMDQIELIEGWYDETLTSTLAAHIGRVDVAMLDADAYSSTVPVLSFLTSLLSSPSIMVFDDWYSGGNIDSRTAESLGLGVERAFREWLDANPSWEATPIGDYDLIDRSGEARKAGRVFSLVQVERHDQD